MAASGIRDEMIQFLKKWSPVDNAFVDDFFGQVDPSAPNDEPSVDLQFVSKWLGVKKFNLMKTLKASYSIGHDYTISKPPRGIKGRGMSTYRTVMLTPDCFKTLCMMSRSAQSSRVRDYFIAVERTLFRYRAEIVQAMQQRIGQLERNQRPLNASVQKTGLIYVIQSGESRVKLGRTGDLAKRLRSHSSALADGMDILYVYKTDDMVAVEACAKSILRKLQYRKYKEIYEADLVAIKSAIEGCGELCNKVQRSMKPTKKTIGGDGRQKHFLVFPS
jgi:phage anti-repressor protein